MSETADSASANANRQANSTAAGGGAAYILAMIGSVSHYWQQADSGGDKFFALIKGLLWPAFVVYDVLSYIN